MGHRAGDSAQRREQEGGRARARHRLLDAQDAHEHGAVAGVIRGCAICQHSPATRSVCCGQRLCDGCTLTHPCPRAAELLAMTKSQARDFLSQEDSLTTAIVGALSKLPEIERAWQSRKRGGVRAN